MYSVVKFVEQSGNKETVSTIPSNWIVGNTAFWPTDNAAKAIRALKKPNSDWKKYPIKIFVKDVAYDKAREKERLAEFTSDMNSEADSDGSGRRKKNKYSYPWMDMEYSSSEDSEEKSSLPMPPKPNNEFCSETEYQKKFKKFSKKDLPGSNIHKQKKLMTKNTDQIGMVRDASQSVSSIESSPTTSTSPSSSCDKVAVSPIHIHVSNEKKETSATSNSDEFRQVLRSLTFIKFTLAEHSEMLSRLVQRETTPLCNEEIVLEPFPLNSVSDLEDVEKKCFEDKAYKITLTNAFSNIGGNNAGDKVFRLLRKMMTDVLADEFSWLGMKGKRPFAKLHLAQICMQAVKKGDARATDREIETFIMSFLRHAKSRLARKK